MCFNRAGRKERKKKEIYEDYDKDEPDSRNHIKDRKILMSSGYIHML